MGEEDDEEEQRMEEFFEAIKVAAAITYFEEHFEAMPYPLKIIKFRRWLKDFGLFMKGVEFGEMLALKSLRETQGNVKKKRIEVMNKNE